MQEIVTLTNAVARHPDYRLAAPVSLSLYKGVPVAVCGRNGSGKTFLVDMLRAAHPVLGDNHRFGLTPKKGGHVSDLIRYVCFRDVYGGTEPAYYQQRWNRGDEEVFPTVREILYEVGNFNKETEKLDKELFCADAFCDRIGLTPHLDKPVNLLSSGELRRFQLTRVLCERPQWLIIDNPYIGLDAEARETLTLLLQELARELTLMLVVSRISDIPAFITDVIHVEEGRVFAPTDRGTYLSRQTLAESESDTDIQLPDSADDTPATLSEACTIIDFRTLRIGYGDRRLFDGFSWRVKRGEHWALMGRNGSGKTTLLSLVCADNPLAYACDISLFGRRRGSGESIWEIKKHIGYVSPEIFTTYRKNLTAAEIVASGLHDTVGLYRRPHPADMDTCREWLNVFGALHLADRPYLTLSSGEQRLVLLVRAFVKSPDLLVLDEPFHGLDDNVRRRAMRVIDKYMGNPRRTLILVSHYASELPSCIDHRLNLSQTL